MENKTLSQEELQQLQELREKEATIMQNIGYIEVIHRQQIDSMFIEYNSLKSHQEELAKSLQTKYGDGNINLTTGEFEPVIS